MISEKTNFATYLKQKAKPCNISIEVLEDITIKQVHISKGEYWYWLAPAKKEGIWNVYLNGRKNSEKSLWLGKFKIKNDEFIEDAIIPSYVRTKLLLQYAINTINKEDLEYIRFYFDVKCCICGTILKSCDSIRKGMGPTCAKRQQLSTGAKIDRTFDDRNLSDI